MSPWWPAPGPEGWLRGAWERNPPVLAAGLGTLLSLGYRAALLVRGLSYDWHLLSHAASALSSGGLAG